MVGHRSPKPRVRVQLPPSVTLHDLIYSALRTLGVPLFFLFPFMFRLVAPVKQARPGPPLAPILGQHQIKVVDFIAEFNRQTVCYVEGLPLGCRITKLPGVGKFTLLVTPPTWSTLLFSLDRGGWIGRAALYTALYYRLGRLPDPADLSTVLGVVRSCRLQLR